MSEKWYWMMSSYQTSVSIKHIPGKSWLSVKGTPNREEKKTTTTGRKIKLWRKTTGHAAESNAENTKSDTQQVLILHSGHEVCIKISRGVSKRKNLRDIHFIIWITRACFGKSSQYTIKSNKLTSLYRALPIAWYIFVSFLFFSLL